MKKQEMEHELEKKTTGAKLMLEQQKMQAEMQMQREKLGATVSMDQESHAANLALTEKKADVEGGKKFSDSLGKLEEGITQLAEGQQAMMAALQHLAQVMAAPTEVVRDQCNPQAPALPSYRPRLSDSQRSL